MKHSMPVVIGAFLLVFTLAINLGKPPLSVSARDSQLADAPWQTQATQTTQASEIQALQTALAEPTGTPRPASTSAVSSVATAQPGTGSLPQKLLPVVESLHPYKNFTKEEFTVSNRDAKASATRLHLSRLDLEDGVDWLIIMDGLDVELQRLTGAFLEGVWTDFVPGNLLRLRLVSDGSVASWGFAADAVESETFTSLGYSAHPYPSYSKQTWQFNNLDAEAEATRLHFSRLDLEKDVDWLILMDLTETPYEWITGQYTQGLWSRAVPGTGILLKLISDSSVGGWGFNVDSLESTRAEKAQAQPEPGQPLAESKHPYEDGTASWILVNPNPAAAYTKVHFARLDIGNGRLTLTDSNGNPVQTLGDNTHVKDWWSDDVPGRVVKVYLQGWSTKDWGFRADRVVTGIAQAALAESKHPYEDGTVSYTITSANPAAAFTRVHFSRLDIDNGRLLLLDGNEKQIQAFGDNTHAKDFWSEQVPGRVVKLKLEGWSQKGWGFRIDDVAPKVEEKPLPAFINAVYVHVGQPSAVWLNGTRLWQATQPGDYLVRLPELGENPIAVETLFHEQKINVMTARDGGVRIEYSGIQPKPAPTATATK